MREREVSKQANIQQVLVIFWRSLGEIEIILQDQTYTDRATGTGRCHSWTTQFAKLWGHCFTVLLEGKNPGFASWPTLYVLKGRVEITSIAMCW